MRRALFRSLSAILAWLPLDRDGREAVKAAVYGRLGFLFRSSDNYQAWRRAHPDERPRAGWAKLEAPTAAAWAGLERPPLGEDGAAEGTPYVVVPVHRGRRETLACLHAVRATAPDTRLVVVDDASPEPALVRALDRLAADGHFVLLRNRRNEGYLGAVERGIAFDPSADVVLLNSDCVVFGDWLERLQAAAYGEPDLGTVTPLSNNGDIASYPHPQRDQRAGLERSLETLDAFARAVNGGQVVDAPTGVGFCLYVKRACLDASGGFGDVFRAGYGEENDFACRASAAGWRHGLAADVLVRHEGARSFGARAPRLREHASKALALRHPDFEDRVAAFVKADPLWAARARIDAARLRETAGPGRPAVLLVCHDWGGGIEGHLVELARRYADAGRNAFVLRIFGETDAPRARIDPSPSAEPLPDLGALGGFAPSRWPDLGVVLGILGVDQIHLHHTGPSGAAGAESVRRLARATRLPLDVTIHDYASICPRLHLEDEYGAFCGEPDESGCRECLSVRGSRFGGVEIGSYRSVYDALLRDARRVLCPTADVRRRLEARFPEANLVVRPPPESPSLRSLPPRPAARRGEDAPLRVLVPGAINDQKGFRVLCASAEAARRRDLPLEFHVVGFTRDDRAARAAGVRVHGRYAPEEADAVLLGHASAPCVAWLPSVAPETWSAVLSSVLRLGLHPVAFDLGALAERIRAIGRGTLLGPEAAADADGLCDRLVALRSSPEAGPGSPIEESLGLPGLPALEIDPSPAGATPVVFLDRDGVLNREKDAYVRTLADWSPLPGSLEAVARLSRAGFRVVLVSNQSGLGRGFIEAESLARIHARLEAQVEALGGRIDGLFVCPHRPEEGCACRKPGIGLLREAEEKLGVALVGAAFVGDRRTDAEAALAVGAQPILVETGRALPAPDDPIWDRTRREPDLASAAERLIREADASRPGSAVAVAVDEVERLEPDAQRPIVVGEAELAR